MRFFFLLVFIFIIQFVFAQNRRLDSLNAALKDHPKDDTIRVQLLNELSLRILKIKPKQSLAYADNALKLAQRLKFQRGMGEAKNNLAVYNMSIGNADVALAEAFECVKIGEQNNLTELTANGFATLGTIYQKQLDYNKAVSFTRQAQILNSQINNTLIASKTYNTLGLILVEKKNYDSAMFYFKEALAIMEKRNEDYRVPEVIINIGLIYTRQKKNATALDYYYRALDAANKGYNRRAQALALLNIGSTVLSERKYAEAEKLLLQSLALSIETQDAKVRGANYMALAQLKNETGKFDEAHVYFSSFYGLKDSLLNAEKVKKIAELEIRYETEKKENAIQILERDKKIQLLWTNILIVALILVAILSAVIYYLQEYRDRKNRMILNLEIDRLTAQHKELSAKYKDVLAGDNAPALKSIDQQLLKKAIEVVENNMGDPLFGVEQMAKEMGMSRTNLHRKLKAITGFPPSELIRNIRMRRAAQLLMSQSDSIAQISFTVGFEDHSYFSKSFKKQFGVTPSEYFQSMRQMN